MSPAQSLDPPPIPSRPSDLTGDWFTAAFRYSGITESEVQAVGHTVLEGTSGQDGHYIIVDLEYGARNAIGAPKQVFAKIIDLPPERRKPIHYSQTVRELTFYREFASRLPARIPAFYYGDYDPVTHDNVLVTESLAGWHMGDSSVGIDLAKALAVARELGRIHGATLGDPILEAPHELLDWSTDAIRHMFSSGFTSAWSAHRAALSGRLSSDVVELCDSLEARLNDLMAEIESRRRSLNHGDCRVDNMAFSGSGHATQVAIFDWGVASAGNGIRDLAQVIGTSLLHMTEAAFAEIVRVYGQELEEASGTSIPFDELWAEFRTAILVALGIRIATLRQVADLSLQNPIVRMRTSAIQRVASAAEILEC